MPITVEFSVTNLILLGVIVFAIKKLIKAFKKWRMDQMLEKWQTSPKDKVILHALWRCKTLPSISPYALKLETYLRMAQIPYELDTKDSIGPKGQLPWITHNGNHIADSHLIIQYLNKKFAVNLNQNSSPEDVSKAKACKAMLENHFLWGTVQYRWIENPSVLSQLMKIPLLLKVFMPLRAHDKKRRMVEHGIGKHTATEIYQMTEDDLRTVAKILGNRKFIGGDQPCEDEASIFGCVAQAVWGMPGSSFEKLMDGELANLKEYCGRIKEHYWPDWESCLDRS